jgi:23S rRNA U2552 (ribose-2'-O)-methylase RlmE/FtsJ
MLNFLLPRLPPTLYTHLRVSSDAPGPATGESEIDACAISPSLARFLCEIKAKIGEHGREWNVYKKYTNPYEFINTCVPTKRRCVAKHAALSRSYFKMVEMMVFFHLDAAARGRRVSCFHLAEGPGGFIEAVATLLDRADNRYVGMTLMHNDASNPNVPAWKTSAEFMRANPNVEIETGADGTGDLLSLANFEHVARKYAGEMDIVTADGGFDFSTDFDNQESNMARMVFAQVAYALVLQRTGGSFVLKIFDSFMTHTIEILALLSSLYGSVYVCKPQTSRYANSEKYVVCTDFLPRTPGALEPLVFAAFARMSEPTEDGARGLRFLAREVPFYFVSKLDEYNAIFGQQQIEFIHSTISLIENKNRDHKTANLVKNNVFKCTQWCEKYRVAHY